MIASFFHYGDAMMASYRYRAHIPSRELGLPLRDESADVWILSKPDKTSPVWMDRAKFLDKKIIVDVCDAHLGLPYYQDAIRRADLVTTSSAFTAQLIQDDFGIQAVVIDDPYEFNERTPHVKGSHLFWFGHKNNYHGLQRYLPLLESYSLRVMSNVDGCLPWSLSGLEQELQQADIVLITDSAPHKSANRAVEAIRTGCFVVAEPHPSLAQIHGIWVGNLLKGIEWAIQHPDSCNAQLMKSQEYVRERFSPVRVANAWRTVIQACASSSAVGINPGRDGSTLMATAPVLTPTL